ncbi:MAG: sulfatase [Bacteroidales bacterium]
MKTCHFFSLLAAAAASSLSGLFGKMPADKPNIIILLVDDLGWRDVGFMGSKFFETPVLDRLASESIVFTIAYAAAAVSSPTRASLLTGRYPARVGITDWIRARFQLAENTKKIPPAYEENEGKRLRTPSNPYRMELEEITIAELLKNSGYFTCHISKWHLGTDDYYPEKQGFDLNIAGNDMGQPVNYFDPYKNQKGVGFPNLQSREPGEYLEDRLADELVKVIEDHKNTPFFISMCYYAVHTPLMAKEELIEKYKRKAPSDGQKNPVYAAMIESLDNAAGKLLATLEKNNLMNNTIIFFLSDNGGLTGSTDNSPLRAGKGYPYEGGIRIPMFIHWKNHITHGSVCNIPVSTVDIMPAICKITGTDLPEKVIDGRDISPLFYGRELKTVPLFWHFPHYRGNDIVPYSIIRDGDWKLIKRYEGKEFELFNLREDEGEKNDLSGEMPGMVNILNKKLTRWLVDVEAKLPLEK